MPNRSQESTACRVVVDESTHAVPHLGDASPLVDQDGRRVVGEHGRVGCKELRLVGRIESSHGDAATGRGRRLADAFGPVEQERRKLGEELIEFIVDHSALIAVGERDHGPFRLTIRLGHPKNFTIYADQTVQNVQPKRCHLTAAASR